MLLNKPGFIQLPLMNTLLKMLSARTASSKAPKYIDLIVFLKFLNICKF